jgi:hypothetical protein
VINTQVDAGEFLLWSVQFWLHLSDISWSYKELSGTEHQFGLCIRHRLSVRMNIVIAIFGTECVMNLLYNHCDSLVMGCVRM